jgi:hypothetical protein
MGAELTSAYSRRFDVMNRGFRYANPAVLSRILTDQRFSAVTTPIMPYKWFITFYHMLIPTKSLSVSWYVDILSSLRS